MSVIVLPLPSHHLSALWIQLQGPKGTSTLQLRRLIRPLPSPLTPPRPTLHTHTSCFVFIGTHLCFCVTLTLDSALFGQCFTKKRRYLNDHIWHILAKREYETHLQSLKRRHGLAMANRSYLAATSGRQKEKREKEKEI